MKLTRLCKSAGSTAERKCPAIYATDVPSSMVGQGKVLDAETTHELLDLAADEVGAIIPTETVLRAAALFLASHGRPAMIAEVEEFLSTFPAAGS